MQQYLPASESNCDLKERYIQEGKILNLKLSGFRGGNSPLWEAKHLPFLFCIFLSLPSSKIYKDVEGARTATLRR